MNNNRKNRVLKYSIRRLSIGVVSVIVGAFAIFGASIFESSKNYGVVYANDDIPDKYKNNKVSVDNKTVTIVLEGFTKYTHNIREINIMFESNGYKRIKLNKKDFKTYSTEIDEKLLDNKNKFKIEIKEYELYIFFSTKGETLLKKSNQELVEVRSPEYDKMKLEEEIKAEEAKKAEEANKKAEEAKKKAEAEAAKKKAEAEAKKAELEKKQKEERNQLKPGIKKGWEKKADNKWYFVKDNGELARSEWLYDNNYSSWYYFNNNGDMASNKWIKHTDNEWYYLFKNGKMAKNEWFYDNNYSSWYYFNNNGDMATNKWIKDTNSKWYYLLGNGKMAKSYWLYDNDYSSWYYFNNSGDMATNKWVKDINSKWYYLLGNGKMAKSTTINGWYVNANGVWEK
ncbi:YSIRK-type signal peptide-containing protein [Helcococcus ovis]|uniref:YSIRK-type signal peptide-containing protein n=1 Tax=Helcococcus ovis TaxID=72026 RepID=UPI0038B6DAA2